jgi:hypothetical protein
MRSFRTLGRRFELSGKSEHFTLRRLQSTQARAFGATMQSMQAHAFGATTPTTLRFRQFMQPTNCQEKIWR